MILLSLSLVYGTGEILVGWGGMRDCLELKYPAYNLFAGGYADMLSFQPLGFMSIAYAEVSFTS